MRFWFEAASSWGSLVAQDGVLATEAVTRLGAEGASSGLLHLLLLHLLHLGHCPNLKILLEMYFFLILILSSKMCLSKFWNVIVIFVFNENLLHDQLLLSLLHLVHCHLSATPSGPPSLSHLQNLYLIHASYCPIFMFLEKPQGSCNIFFYSRFEKHSIAIPWFNFLHFIALVK